MSNKRMKIVMTNENRGKTFKGKATAYYVGKYTKTGLPVGIGIAAVDLKKIPPHSVLYVTLVGSKFKGLDKLGFYIAEDTGGFVRNNNGTIIDLYWNDKRIVKEFGRRSVIVEIMGTIALVESERQWIKKIN